MSNIRIDYTQHLEVEVTSLSSSHQCAKDVLSCVNDLVLLCALISMYMQIFVLGRGARKPRLKKTKK
jgi:hypothetical protein